MLHRFFFCMEKSALEGLRRACYPPGVILSETNVDWLKALPGVVGAGDLEATYAFRHPLNHSRELTRQSLQQAPAEESLLWWVELRTAKGEVVLEPGLARRVLKSAALASVKENGPVVRNELFMIKKPFQRQGLARCLYDAELGLYQRWGVREIHISARDEGCVVWPKRFGFLPSVPGYLRAAYASWASRREAGVQPAPSQISEYPDEFLRSLSTLELYKVLS